MVLVKLSHNMKKRKKWGFPLFRCLSWYRVSLWGGNKGTESTYQPLRVAVITKGRSQGSSHLWVTVQGMALGLSHWEEEVASPTVCSGQGGRHHCPLPFALGMTHVNPLPEPVHKRSFSPFPQDFSFLGAPTCCFRKFNLKQQQPCFHANDSS